MQLQEYNDDQEEGQGGQAVLEDGDVEQDQEEQEAGFELEESDLEKLAQIELQIAQEQSAREQLEQEEKEIAAAASESLLSSPDVNYNLLSNAKASY